MSERKLFKLGFDPKRPMIEIDFWLWLNRFGEGVGMHDKALYLQHRGFTKELHRLSEEDYSALKSMFTHYQWSKFVTWKERKKKEVCNGS